MLRKEFLKPVFGAAALALLVSAPVYSQTASSAGGTGDSSSRSATAKSGASGDAASSDTGSKAGAGARASGSQSDSSGSSAASGSSDKKAAAGKLSDEERDVMKNLAEANLAEIQTSKLALEKSTNPKVKSFAQQMIDDHQKMHQELQKLASAKGVELPKEPGIKHKASAAMLRALSGETFDNRYMSQVGVDDHQNTHSMLEDAKSKVKDPELKALLDKGMPTIGQHLKTAKSIDSEKSGKSSSGASDSSGSGSSSSKGASGSSGSSSGSTSK